MISLNDFNIERKIDKAISKFPMSVKPTKQEFIKSAVTSYIDLLIKEKIIKGY